MQVIVKIFTDIRLAWFIVAVLTMLLIAPTPGGDVAVTRSFCAYGRIFVEFEEGDKKWGVLMLDWDGHPMQCADDSVTPIEDKGNVYDKFV